MSRSLLLVTLIALAGCTYPRTSPVSPSASLPSTPVSSSSTSAAPVAPAAQEPPAFALSIASFKVQLYGSSSSDFEYWPVSLQIVETSGASSATLKGLAIDVAGGYRDGYCSQADVVKGQVIPAGGSRDLVANLGYCVPYADSKSEVSTVTFTAVFADDQGRTAKVEGSANVAGCTLAGRAGQVSCQ